MRQLQTAQGCTRLYKLPKTALRGQAGGREVFEALDKAEDVLSRQRYIAGDQFTEADIRLFCTLIRFDHVYVVGPFPVACMALPVAVLYMHLGLIWQSPSRCNACNARTWLPVACIYSLI